MKPEFPNRLTTRPSIVADAPLTLIPLEPAPAPEPLSSITSVPSSAWWNGLEFAIHTDWVVASIVIDEVCPGHFEHLYGSPVTAAVVTICAGYRS